MASMRDIKRRKSSIQSTQQITKAMKLVSTVKLQKAKNRAEQTNPYFQYMYRTVTSMLAARSITRISRRVRVTKKRLWSLPPTVDLPEVTTPTL